MPTESEFQSFFKYNRWMLAIIAIMILIILGIMIWIAVTVNSKINEVQNIINLLKNPLDTIVEYLLKITPKAEDTISNTKDTILSTKDSVLNNLRKDTTSITKENALNNLRNIIN